MLPTLWRRRPGSFRVPEQPDPFDDGGVPFVGNLSRKEVIAGRIIFLISKYFVHVLALFLWSVFFKLFVNWIDFHIPPFF
jgi:hypothetical protein